ncbi:oligosaccharide flippase family protein [uncultured Cellulomonas sp.]|uniref:oligosaccharide flippase family protein n=1 Tax=uncultured Cellulomonas sp. TaxID=189682 RepID=UPI0026093EEF|nr:oligosaccharide flippase family protein [uncultured Cellulomonas sp.]
MSDPTQPAAAATPDLPSEPGEPSATPAPGGSPGGLRQKAVTGVMWTATEKWSLKLSTLVGFIILGNLLSPVDFGIVALAMSFIGFLTTLADGGFSAYLVQKQRLTSAITSTSFWSTSALALLLALALVALAPLFSRLLDVPELTAVLRALALALFISGLSVVPAALMSREMQFKQLAIRQISATVVSVVVAIALALGGAGVWALVAQTLVRSVVALIILWLSTDFRPRFTFDRGEARAMTSYGSKSLAVGMQVQLRAQGQLLIIGALAGPVVVGYWTVAGRLVGVVVDVFSSVVGAVAHPVFARLQGSPERLSRALSSTRALSSLVLVPALVLLALVSKDVVPAVFGDQWTPTTTVASLLAMSALFNMVTRFDRSALLATGHPGAELWVTTVFMVIQLGLAALFATDLELLAAATGLSMVVAVPVRLLVVRRLLGVPLRGVVPTALVLLAGGLAAAAVLGAEALLGLEDWAYVSLAVVIGMVVYVGVILLVARPVVLEAVGMVPARLRRRLRLPGA